jgi:hypothetical protein
MTGLSGTPEQNKVEGVLINAEPKISIVTNEELRVDFVQRSVNAIGKPEFLDFEKEGKAHKIILDSDRVSLAEVNSIRDEYMQLSGDDMFSEFAMIKAEIEVEGKFTGIKPIVRGSRIKGDVILEIDSGRTTEQELSKLKGPSMDIVRTRGKYVISDQFPSGIVLNQLNSEGIASEIANKANARENDITFAARAVTTDVTDTFGL